LFTIENGAGSLFLLTLGFVLTLAAVLGDRIAVESFEILGAKVKVRDVVKSRLELADRTATDPDDTRTTDIRAQARTLQKLAGFYEYIRRTQPVSDERTEWLDDLAIRIQEEGLRVQFDPAEVATWFHEGSDALRVIALNLMLAREEYRDFPAVVKALEDRRSLFEQYYALRLANAMVPCLDELERKLLAYAINRAQHARAFRQDTSSFRLSNTILAQLQQINTRAADQ
jgi:hypothetical protein